MLKGKTALVTGSTSGIGLGIARAFAREGVDVMIHGLGEAAAIERIRAALAEETGVTVRSHAADVSQPDEVRRLIADTEEAFGAIDILVNNAAGNFLAPSEDLSPRAFDAVVRTVLHGTFHTTLAAGRRMIERGAGSILNIVTTYAWTGSAFVVPSAAGKAGVLAMTRSLAVEWATYGIRVNAIAPGPFPTEGAWSALMPTPEVEAQAKARIPAGRFGDHDELTNLAAFLVSDAAPFITGEVVTIDGGEWLGSGGEFNHLTRVPREEVKKVMRKMRR